VYFIPVIKVSHDPSEIIIICLMLKKHLLSVDY